MRTVKLFGGSPYLAVVAGRLANLVVFVIVGASVLQTAAYGTAFLFSVLMLPMTLNLAASMNTDGLLIAFSLLAFALASRQTKQSSLPIAAIIACIGAVKLPYIALAALLDFAWKPHQRGTNIGRASLVCLAVIPGLAWAATMAATVATPPERVSYAAGPLWPGQSAQMFDSIDGTAQWAVLTAHPALWLTLPLDFVSNCGAVLRQAVGVLGWVNLNLPDAIYDGWGIAIAAALFANSIEPGRPARTRWQGVRCGLGTLFGFWAICMSLYLTWTPVGWSHIEGLQGRYFLPLAALIPMIIPPIEAPHSIRTWTWHMLRLFPIVMSVWGMAILPNLLLKTYYTP